MRYSEIDVQCEDIMWFGIDADRHILAFTSGGCGCVPEYVCRSKEETAQLEKFFMEKLKPSCESIMEISDDGSFLTEDALHLSQKGIFVYDVSFEKNHKDEYTIIARPTVPLQIDGLPKEIISVLADHIIECGMAGSKFIHVKHAY